jgi:hypothetical protein
MITIPCDLTSMCDCDVMEDLEALVAGIVGEEKAASNTFYFSQNDKQYAVEL